MLKALGLLDLVEIVAISAFVATLIVLGVIVHELRESGFLIFS